VEEQSAVINGQPSLGLMVDHSGLNKYTSGDDPNMIKIADVAAEMVRSASSGNELGRSSCQCDRMHYTQLPSPDQVHSTAYSRTASLGNGRQFGP
jgi:hypothetical protein